MWSSFWGKLFKINLKNPREICGRFPDVSQISSSVYLWRIFERIRDEIPVRISGGIPRKIHNRTRTLFFENIFEDFLKKSMKKFNKESL